MQHLHIAPRDVQHSIIIEERETSQWFIVVACDRKHGRTITNNIIVDIGGHYHLSLFAISFCIALCAKIVYEDL